MGLKDLHLLARDDRAAYTTDQLLRLAAEHHARDDLDPSWAVGLQEHGPSRYTLNGLGSNGSPEGRGGRESPATLRICGGCPIVLHYSCGFSRPSCKGMAVKKSERPSALALRTKV